MTDAIDSTEFNNFEDPFLGEEFIDRNASLPSVIVLNHEVHCGYFIPVGTMAKCGWINFDENQLIGHTFRSGETEQGVLITQPRMLVCPKTDLLTTIQHMERSFSSPTKENRKALKFQD